MYDAKNIFAGTHVADSSINELTYTNVRSWGNMTFAMADVSCIYCKYVCIYVQFAYLYLLICILMPNNIQMGWERKKK